MEWYEYVMGAAMIILSIVIIMVVIFQQGRQANLSGAIAGGADTFFSKNRARTMDAFLAKATKFIAIAFFLLTIALHSVAFFKK